MGRKRTVLSTPDLSPTRSDTTQWTTTPLPFRVHTPRHRSHDLPCVHPTGTLQSPDSRCLYTPKDPSGCYEPSTHLPTLPEVGPSSRTRPGVGRTGSDWDTQLLSKSGVGRRGSGGKDEGPDLLLQEPCDPDPTPLCTTDLTHTKRPVTLLDPGNCPLNCP